VSARRRDARPAAAPATARRLSAATLTRAALAALLGAAAAVLVACGSSGNGLIPPAQAGPLQVDIEAVEKAAEEGNGDCTATEAALLRTDQDYAALPLSVNSTLRGKLRIGIDNLHKVAREACSQPLARTVQTTPAKTTPPLTTPTTPTPKTTTTPTTPTTPGPEHEESEHGTGGGTAAPSEGAGKSPTEGSGGAGSEESSGGNGAGGSGGSESK
jgi:hypothetical protein